MNSCALPQHASPFVYVRVTNKPVPQDEKLSRLLDVAIFYRWKQECDGSQTAFFQLRKSFGGLAAGSVISLPDLHEKLFGCAGHILK